MQAAGSSVRCSSTCCYPFHTQHLLASTNTGNTRVTAAVHMPLPFFSSQASATPSSRQQERDSRDTHAELKVDQEDSKTSSGTGK